MAGVGTGGTVTGVGEYLKSIHPDVKIIAVEPTSSAVLSTGIPGSHKIQGIGAGFVPDVLNTKVYDEIIAVTNEDAFEIGRLIGHQEGVLVGISSGAAAWAAIELAKRPEKRGQDHRGCIPGHGRPIPVHPAVCRVRHPQIQSGLAGIAVCLQQFRACPFPAGRVELHAQLNGNRGCAYSRMRTLCVLKNLCRSQKGSRVLPLRPTGLVSQHFQHKRPERPQRNGTRLMAVNNLRVCIFAYAHPLCAETPAPTKKGQGRSPCGAQG